MEVKGSSNFMNNALKIIEDWLGSSKAWFELESARLRLEAEKRMWEVENEVLSPELGRYDWEFIEEWV